MCSGEMKGVRVEGCSGGSVCSDEMEGVCVFGCGGGRMCVVVRWRECV